MKVVIVIALLLVVAGCKHETPTMMMRCYNCDTPTSSNPEVNTPASTKPEASPELKPAKKYLPPWQNPSRKYLA
jgi:hypothetical protein